MFSEKDKKNLDNYLILVKKDASKSYLYTGIADIYCTKGFYVDAIKTLENGVKNCKNNVTLYLYLANCYKQLGSSDNIIKVLNHGLKDNPHSFTLIKKIIKYHKNIGNYKEVIQLYEKTIEQEPNSNFLYEELVNLYRRNGDYNKAINVLKKGISNCPNNNNLKSTLSYVRSYLEFNQKGIMPEHIINIVNNVSIKDDKNKYIAYYKKLIENKIFQTDFLINECNLGIAQSNYNEALDLFIKASKLNDECGQEIEKIIQLIGTNES